MTTKYFIVGILCSYSLVGIAQTGFKFGLSHNTANTEFTYGNNFGIGKFKSSTIHPGFSLAVFREFEFAEKFSSIPSIGMRSRGFRGLMTPSDRSPEIEFKNTVYTAFADLKVRLISPLAILFGNQNLFKHYLSVGSRWDLKMIETSNEAYQQNFTENQLLSAGIVADIGCEFPLANDDVLNLELEFSSSLHSNNTSETIVFPYYLNKIQYVSFGINIGYIF